MADIALKHVVFEGDSQLYFYEGSVPVVGGVAVIPSGQGHWAANAFLRGYRFNPETGEEYLPGTIQDIVNDVPAAAVAESDNEESAESEETDDEGSDGERQPVLEDGVRSGEQPRDEGDAGSGAGSGDGDGAADGEAGD